MSKISNDTARKLASILLKEKQEEVTKMREDYLNTAEKEYLKTLPKSVLDFKKKHPGFVNEISSFQLVGTGFNYEYITFNNPVPHDGGRGGREIFSPSEESAEKIKSLQHKYEKATSKIKAVREETIGTLLSLGTAKRIVESFPELSEHLNQVTLAVSIDVVGLKKKISSLP